MEFNRHSSLLQGYPSRTHKLPLNRTSTLCTSQPVVLKLRSSIAAPGKALPDLPGLAVGLLRPVRIAPRPKQLAELGVADREIVLPSGIRRIESGKPSADLQGFFEGLQRPLRIALHPEQFADLAVADREIVLPFGIRRIESGKPLVDLQGFFEGLQRPLRIALRQERLAD